MIKLKTAKRKTVNILGQDYIIRFTNRRDEKILEHADGECRWFSKEIIIDNELNDIVYTKHVIKHEIIHAFLAESGLKKYREDEDIVDWIAWNFDKIEKIFKEVSNVKP